MVLLACAPRPQISTARSPTVPGLKRGVISGGALDAPTEGAWGPALDEAYFDHIVAAGFDHVRIPIRFSAHAALTSPYTVDETFFSRVDWAVEETQRHGMSAIIDFYNYDELSADPGAHAMRFIGIWRQIAARYRARPASVYFELLNEPSGALTADRWNTLLVQALTVVRAVDPTRKVIIDSSFWGAADALRSLRIPAGDPNLIASFHTFQPILFTHQGLPFMSAEYQTTGVVFPGPPDNPIVPVEGAQKVDWVAQWFGRYNTLPAAQNPSGPTTVMQEFEFAHAFVERTQVPVYLGGFGADVHCDRASRLAWTRMVRQEAERLGIGWSYWDDSGYFKVFDRATKRWDEELKGALLK
jgi:endoglucanase